MMRASLGLALRFLGLFWVRISSDLVAVDGLVRVFLDLVLIALDFGGTWRASYQLCLILSV